MECYTVFTDNYDEIPTGRSGSWSFVYRSLDAAKTAVLENIQDIANDLEIEVDDDVDAQWHVFDTNQNWVLDCEDTGTVHTITRTTLVDD